MALTSSKSVQKKLEKVFGLLDETVALLSQIEDEIYDYLDKEEK